MSKLNADFEHTNVSLVVKNFQEKKCYVPSGFLVLKSGRKFSCLIISEHRLHCFNTLFIFPLTQHTPWEVKVTVRGHFIVSLKGIYSGRGDHERIISITDMAKWFPELEITGEDEVVYTATGVLKDVKAEKVELRVKEENLNGKRKKTSKM